MKPTVYQTAITRKLVRDAGFGHRITVFFLAGAAFLLGIIRVWQRGS